MEVDSPRRLPSDGQPLATLSRLTLPPLQKPPSTADVLDDDAISQCTDFSHLSGVTDAATAGVKSLQKSAVTERFKMALSLRWHQAGSAAPLIQRLWRGYISRQKQKRTSLARSSSFQRSRMRRATLAAIESGGLDSDAAKRMRAELRTHPEVRSAIAEAFTIVLQCTAAAAEAAAASEADAESEAAGDDVEREPQETAAASKAAEAPEADR